MLFTLLNALSETLPGIIYFLMEFSVAHLLWNQVALKNHLYKSCVLKDSCYLCLSKMRHRGMNIKCVHKFGCPVCGSKGLFFGV